MYLVDRFSYGGCLYDVFTDKQDIYMSRDQIGRALRYANPRKAIEKIHRRHQQELDRFSVVLKTRTTDGKNYDTFLYSRRGVLEICRHSRQPKAKEVLDKFFDKLEAIAVSQYRVQLQKENMFLEWKKSRDYTKDINHFLTDVIQDFNEYAIRQGSRKFHQYAYINLLKLIRSMTGKYSRDYSSIEALHVVAMACKIVRRAVLDDMAAGMFYRSIYEDCKKRLASAEKMGILD